LGKRNYSAGPARGDTRGRGDGAPLSAGEAWIPVSSLSASGEPAEAGPGARGGGAASRLLGDEEAEAEMARFT